MLHLKVSDHDLSLGRPEDIQPAADLHDPAGIEPDLPIVQRGREIEGKTDVVLGQTGGQLVQLGRLFGFPAVGRRWRHQAQAGQVRAFFYQEFGKAQKVDDLVVGPEGEKKGEV